MPVEFRAIEPEDFDTMTETMGLAFGFDRREGDDRFRAILPLERTRCGFENGRMVSTSAAFELEMTVPGAVAACGGTTVVTVSPTHRRRGLLRLMMRAHLDDVREHGEPMAALWASDSAIYGRFGYGMASVSYDIEVHRGHDELHRLAPTVRDVRLIDVDEAASVLPPFYETVRQKIPGFFTRTPSWWDSRRLADPESARNGMTAQRIGVVEGEEEMEGFLQYRFKSDWEEGHGAGRVMIGELLGTTPESWATLWSFALGHDLTEKTEGRIRPTWDPIFDLLAGTRRARASRHDALWVRIMDIPTALSTRSYSGPIDVVLGVFDSMGDVTGSYRLWGNGDQVECSRSDSEPDVSLDLEDLSACYLGRSRFRDLARVGRVTGTRPALSALDAAFAWDPQPWCPELF